MGVRTSVKNHPFSAWQFGRRFALGAVTLLLVFSAADRSGATSGSQPSQSNGQRGQGTPTKPDAQHSPQRLPWWKDPAIIREINLTPEQAAKVDALWRKREKNEHSVAKELERQRDELTRLMDERRVGVDVISIQHDRVEAQRTILNKSRTVFLYQSSLILTADQNKALKAIYERNRRDRR